jgi:hypothetical protein
LWSETDSEEYQFIITQKRQTPGLTAAKIKQKLGESRLTDNEKEISIYVSKKDIKMNHMIGEACEVINNKEIKIDDKLVKLIPVFEKT